MCRCSCQNHSSATQICVKCTHTRRRFRQKTSVVGWKLVPETFQDDGCTVGGFHLRGEEQQVKQLDWYFNRLLCLSLKVWFLVVQVGTAPPAAADWNRKLRKLRWHLVCWTFACSAKVGKICGWIGPLASAAASKAKKRKYAQNWWLVFQQSGWGFLNIFESR